MNLGTHYPGKRSSALTNLGKWLLQSAFLILLLLSLHISIGYAAETDNSSSKQALDVLTIAGIESDEEFDLYISYRGIDRSLFYENPLLGDQILDYQQVSISGNEIDPNLYYKEFDNYEFINYFLEENGEERILIYYYAAKNEYIEDSIAVINEDRNYFDERLNDNDTQAEEETPQVETPQSDLISYSDAQEQNKREQEQSMDGSKQKEEARLELESLANEGLIDKDKLDELTEIAEDEIDRNIKELNNTPIEESENQTNNAPYLLLAFVVVIALLGFFIYRNYRR